MIDIRLNASAVHGGATDSMRALAEEKLSFLDGRIADDSIVRLTVAPEGKHSLALTVSVTAPDDYHIRLTQVGADYYTALPQLASRLKETLNQHAERMNDRAKRGGEAGADDTHAPEPLPITRHKVVIASAMRESEAIAEAEALGHSLFVFRDTDVTDAPLSLIYQRVEGGWGLMQIR